MKPTLLCTFAAAAALLGGTASAAVNLPQLNIDTTQTTVSGLSSGGLTFANGSAQAMGLWNIFITTTLKMTGANYYVVGSCP